VQVRFLPTELAQWDQAEESDALALSFYSHERPLQGAAGLADWRLHGSISRLIEKEFCRGERRESTIMPATRRLPWQRIFLFGLGASHRMDEEQLSNTAEWMGDVLAKAGVTEYALQVPGRALDLIDADLATEVWCRQSAGTTTRLTIIDSLLVEKKLSDFLSS
jgi:hypothetical protein